MDNRSSVGVTVVGAGLCWMSFPLFIHALIFYPFLEIRWIFSSTILIVFLLLGISVLKLKTYARLLVLFIAVPYLLIAMHVLSSHRYAVELAHFASRGPDQQFQALSEYRYELVHSQKAMIAGEVLIPGFNVGVLIEIGVLLLGLFLLIYFNRAQVKDQFKKQRQS